MELMAETSHSNNFYPLQRIYKDLCVFSVEDILKVSSFKTYYALVQFFVRNLFEKQVVEILASH